MNLDSFQGKVGEWLRGSGNDSDVVVSTRIRLARNLAHFPFTTRASAAQRGEIETKLRTLLNQIDLPPKLNYLSVAELSALERQFLTERQLISRELANAEGPRGVAFDERESVSVMVNEEDHLRLQVIRSGFALDECWETIDRLDDQIEAKVTYAFSEQLGYLTACPTNVGTGMRASVMLHLPALTHTRQLEKVFNSLRKINLVVRGLHGENTRATGDFCQISNQITLGKSEATLLKEIQEVITTTISFERMTRAAMLRERRQIQQDQVARALGTLRSATMMTSDETMELLSVVRLGIAMDLLPGLSIPDVNSLFLNSQAAHLQHMMGNTLDGEARNAARAKFLREKLRELSEGR